MGGRGGYSLVEVLMGIAVLAVLSLGWMSFDVTIQNELQRSVNASKAQKVFLIIQSDILRNDRFMASREPIPELEAAAVTEAVLAQTFVDADFVTNRCYSDGGADLGLSFANADEPTPACPYQVSFYKVRQRDLGYPATSDLSRIPLSRVNIRVRYFAPTQIPDPVTGLRKKLTTRYFSRLTAQVAAY